MVSTLSSPENFLANSALPVLITYKDFVDVYKSNADDALSATISKKTMESLPDDVKIVLMIDGIDEKKQTIEEQIESIKALATFASTHRRRTIVVTSRYLNRIGSSRNLGISGARYEIRALSLNKVLQFLKVICTRLDAKSRLIEDLKKSPLFRELPKSPIAAILLAQLLNENPDDLPSSMTELYSKYTELMLGRWDMEKGLQSQKEYEALDNILMEIAAYVIENELVFVSQEEVLAFFTRYLKDRNLEIDPTDLLNTALTRSEIITKDPNTELVSFKHRTFAEFLSAKHSLRKGTPPVDNRAFQTYWLSVFFFQLGLQKDAPERIRGIIELEPKTEGERIVKFINMGSYLLAAYSTPYEILTDGLAKALKDAGLFFEDLVTGKSSSFFSHLSRMTAMFLFQMLLRDAYSYTFFRKAIESAALMIDDDPSISTNAKIYSLFFLNVAYIDSGDRGNFDFLLERYSDHLPLDIAFAVQHEGVRCKVRTDLMKRNDRRVRRVLKNNKAVGNQVRALYERPIILGNTNELAKPE